MSRHGVRLSSPCLVVAEFGTDEVRPIRLAYAELFLATAIIQRRFDTELFETERDDIDPLYDFFVAAPRLGSQGMRIMVK